MDRLIYFFLALLIQVQLAAIPADSYLGGQYSYYFTNNLWTKDGHNQPAYNEFMRHDSKVYGGFDISPSTCVWGQGGFDSIRQQVNPDRHGIEDSNLGLYHTFGQKGGSSCGGGLQLFVPGGEYRPALRYGTWAAELFFSLENRFRAIHYTLDVGYRIYEGTPSDMFRVAIRFDWPLSKRIQLTAQGDCDLAVNNGKKHFCDNKTAFNPNTRLFKAKILGVYQLSQTIYLNMGYFKYIWGQNTGSGAGVFGGVFWNY